MKETESIAKGRFYVWIALVAFYLVIKFGFTSWLDGVWLYSSYVFELVLVIVSILLTGQQFTSYFRVTRATLFASIGALVAGFLVLRGAVAAGIQVPFNLEGTETLLFLLIVAPILEELVFRFFLWIPVEQVTKKSLVAWIATSLLFSYSHFHPRSFLPEEIHPFIDYQTAYTLVLGFACGYFVHRDRSIAGAIAIHFAFNLGFFLGAL